MARLKENKEYYAVSGRLPIALKALLIQRCKELKHTNKDGKASPTKYINDLMIKDLKATL
jgi:hypothetical protein